MVSARWIYNLMLCVVSVCIALEQSQLEGIHQASTAAVEILAQPSIYKEPSLEVEYLQLQPSTTSTVSVVTITVYSTSLPKTSNHVMEKKTTPLLQQILAPVMFIYNNIHSIISRIFRVVAFFVSPLVKTTSLLLNMFVFKPLLLMQYLLTTLYPVFFFLTIAMVTGICFGAVGGWISEVIFGILAKSKRPQLKSSELNRNYNHNHSHGFDKFQMQHSIDSSASDEWYEEEDIE